MNSNALESRKNGRQSPGPATGGAVPEGHSDAQSTSRPCRVPTIGAIGEGNPLAALYIHHSHEGNGWAMLKGDGAVVQSLGACGRYNGKVMRHR